MTVVVLNDINRKCLDSTIMMLNRMEVVKSIIIIDINGDETSEAMIKETGCDYILCDSKSDRFGQIVNAVFDNYNLDDEVMFVQSGVVFSEDDLIKIKNTLSASEVGITSPMNNRKLDILNANSKAELLDNQIEDFNILAVSDFIWVINKETYKKVGRFNEELIKANSVLIDYVFRMLKIGLHAKASASAFADVRLVTAELEDMLNRDRMVLKGIYGMNYFNTNSNPTIVSLIEGEDNRELNILEIGCDLGATLLDIKKHFPRCNIYGLEINENAVDIAKYYIDAKVGNIEANELDDFWPNVKFDYCIFGDVLEHLHDPEGVIGKLHNNLSENGCIVASVPNLMHISVIRQLLSGKFHYDDVGLLDRTHIHFFTFYEMLDMFERQKYKDDIVMTVSGDVSEADITLVKELMPLTNNEVKEHMFITFQYVGRFRKQY